MGNNDDILQKPVLTYVIVYLFVYFVLYIGIFTHEQQTEF